MSVATPPRRYTPDDLLTMPDGDRYELVNGELVERKLSMESSWIAGQVFANLHNFVAARGSGWVFPEGTSYQCFREEPRRVRKPDTSFIKADRLPDGPLPEGHCPIAPDLVVEVISPNDLFYQVDIKVGEWLRAGTRLVWVLAPATKAIYINRTGEPAVTKLTCDHELTGEDVLPEFHCPVKDFFPKQTHAAVIPD